VLSIKLGRVDHVKQNNVKVTVVIPILEDNTIVGHSNLSSFGLFVLQQMV
jgi:hypothetical protein